MVDLKTIADIIEAKAPLETQESWDNSGWQIRLGNPQIKRVLTALELSEEVAEEAISRDVQLIVCHHPLIFGGIKKVDSNTVIGNIICRLIEKGISVYATHTPFDKCEGGNNDYLAKLLDLREIQSIPGDDSGICRMGNLEEPKTAVQLAMDFAEKTGQDRKNYRMVGCAEEYVNKVGLCTGAGAEFFRLAAAAGCSLFITGDVKYHEAQQARELEIGLLDMGHFGSEQIFTVNMASILRKALGDYVEILESEINLNPFTAVE